MTLEYKSLQNILLPDPSSPGELQNAHHQPDCQQVREALDKTIAKLEIYRSIYESLPFVHFILDSAGVILVVNEMGATHLGYPTEELVCSSILEFVHSEDRPRLQAELNSVLPSQSKVATSEFRLICKDGRFLWMKALVKLAAKFSSIQQTAENAAILLCCEDITEQKRLAEELENYRIGQDITERKQAEAALQESEERYRSVVTAMAEGVVLQDSRGVIYTCNLAAARILGLPPEQIMGRTSLDPRWQPIHEDGSPFEGEQHPAMVTLRTGKPCSDIVMGIHKPDGSLTWISINSQPLFRPGELFPYAVVTSFSDITARKQAQEALYRREQEFEALAENSPDVIARFDRMLRHLYVNPTVERITGIPREEFIGKTNRDLHMPPDLIEFWDAKLQEVFTTGQDRQIEYSFSTPQGCKTFSSRIVPEFKPDGTIESSLAVTRDITNLKQAEIILRQQAEQEQVIAQVTQQIRRSLNLHEVLNTTVNSIRECLHSDRVAIYQLESDGSGTVVAESVDDSYPQMLGKKLRRSWLKERFSGDYQDLPTIMYDIHQSDLPAHIIEFLQFHQVKAGLAASILNGEHLWGLLIAHQCAALRQWQTFEVNLLQQLANQVAIAIQQSELYQQVQAANQELQRVATLDGLTQIANRRGFDEYINSEWLRLKREQASLSLIMLDVDYFKRYNDTYGHLAGDDCLRQIASDISSVVRRPADLLARYGGEEFAVILPYTDLEGAIYVAEAIRQKVVQLAIPHSRSSVSDRVTVSLGVACIVPNSELSPQDLINAADKALYTAKQQGRDRVCW